MGRRQRSSADLIKAIREVIRYVRALVLFRRRSLPTLNDKTKPLIDPDRVSMADRTQVARATVQIFDKLEGRHPAHVQLLAMACAFRLLCMASRLRLPDVGTACENLMHDPLAASGMEPRFDAMRYHLESHLLSGDVK